MAAYTALEKEEDRHGEAGGSRGRVVVWLRLPDTQGTLCSSALRLDGQANPGVNESSFMALFILESKRAAQSPGQ